MPKDVDKSKKTNHFCAFCHEQTKTHPHLEIKELQACVSCSFDRNFFQLDTPDNARESEAFTHLVKMNELAMGIYKILEEDCSGDNKRIEYILIKLLLDEMAQMIEDWNHYG